MAKQEIEEFAKILLREVRDKAIASCDVLLRPETNNVISRRWRSHINSGPSSELGSVMIPDCVDDTLFYLLHAIDTGVLRLSFIDSNGVAIDLTADGEMAGWFLRTDGWRAVYSNERFVDDFKHED